MAALRTLALVLGAVILVPAGAHVLELPGKIGMDRDAYALVQSIYRGWALFGIPIVAAVLANGALFVALRRREPAQARWALAACLLILASLGVFFVWVFPANQATANWTTLPDVWENLRRDWEYGHAAAALLVAAAFLATVMATVRR
ncbi:hypothetical protein [Azospirillum sp. ST 5-10]|uniref:hypothetical protein n=1 Tax=unclassified Azospirillum TaxID=2630922 RepID=UPI003F4A2C5F